MRERRLSWITQVVVAGIWIVPTAMLISFLSGEHRGEQRSKVQAHRRSVAPRMLGADAGCGPVFVAEEYYDL